MTLKKKWFDMILSGEKKEEYREIKPYWATRFENLAYNKSVDDMCIRFTNGYGSHRPSLDIELNMFSAGKGKEEWGAINGNEYYILKLGKILEKRNIS